MVPEIHKVNFCFNTIHTFLYELCLNLHLLANAVIKVQRVKESKIASGC